MIMFIRSKWQLSLVVLHLATLLRDTEAQLRVYAETGLKIEPVVDRELSTFVVITCNVELTNATVPTRWIAPNGQIIDRSFGRYRIGQGSNENGVWSTLLAIQNVSYRDAGYYTCEVVPSNVLRSQCECVDFPFSATTELQLQVNLAALQGELTATEGATTSVELGCEMSGYLRPDEDLQWYRDNRLLLLKGARHSVSIKEGRMGAGQSGENTTVHSRLSVLNIHHPSVADSGVYSCRVRGTTAEALMSLAVTGSQVTGPLTNTPDPDKGQSTESEKPTVGVKTDGKNGKVLIGDANGNSPRKSIGVAEVAIIVCTTCVTTAVVTSLLTLTVACYCLRRKRESKLSEKQLVSSPSSDVHLDCSYTSADSIGVSGGTEMVAMLSQTT